MRKFVIVLLAVVSGMGILVVIASLATAQSGVILPSGSNTLKSIHFSGYPGLGIYSPSAGVMFIGDASNGISCTNGSGCSFSGTVTSGALTVDRADLVEDALQPYGISIHDLRQTTGIPLVAAETAGNFDITYGTNTIVANGEVTDNETEVSVVWFQFVLPPEYVAAGDVSIRLPAALIATGSPTNNGSTIDVAVYEQASGAVGSDLSTTTAAATFAALDTWYNKDFVITATDLVAGDILNVKITASVIDSEAGAGTIILNLDPPRVLLDIKG